MRRLIPLELVVCPLCGADSSTPLVETPDHFGYVDGSFTVVRCRVCGLGYQNPRPTAAAFEAIYPPSYTPYQTERIEPGSIPPDLVRACAFIAQQQPAGGHLLDVGAGVGSFLHALALLQPHWQTCGLEPSPLPAAQAAHHGVTMQIGTLATAELAAQTWDAVTLWNVLEHLPNPLADLQRIRQLLRPNGCLYLTLPLYDSWDARLFGPYWLGWELPRHFIHFDRVSLTRMLHEAGFALLRMASLSGIDYCADQSMHIALRALVRNYTAHRLSQALIFSRPARMLCWRPYLQLATWRQRTTVVTIVAQPR
ncbi:class I SAM-dependent methyltransferase [Candidatus Viridilinea mediisalina]|uniref:Methyltransferase type 12 n=1 Tax=Candidatus Viridilinea mediisalina TaxID=2024553 RepID=A0A2A6RLW7_9CHLR|nr:class I SAM-dependent methyltransferase [Candidatus Viridilinea mediisalina]PDW03891.1 hypothetical protein CJ255_06465 [Candidatus Viridilinea mediisalina]